MCTKWFQEHAWREMTTDQLAVVQVLATNAETGFLVAQKSYHTYLNHPELWLTKRSLILYKLLIRSD